jgi:hypothetical protein
LSIAARSACAESVFWAVGATANSKTAAISAFGRARLRLIERPALLRWRLDVVVEQIRELAKGGQRRAKVVRHRRDKVRLQLGHREFP